jgi:vitamin B12 transporter
MPALDAVFGSSSLRGLVLNTHYRPQGFAKFLLTFCLPATVLALSAAAQADQSGNLDEIVVVAMRAPESIDKVGNSVTVLTEVQIKESQSIDLTELLATTPGVTFSRNGGPGSQTSLNIRGADSDHTVILIDGVVMTDPSTLGGNIDFGNLIVGDTTRIEILRGAQSTLYGSQAIGGVINIETAKPQENFGGSLQAERGSLDSGLAQGAIGGKIDNLSFRVAGSYYATDSVSDFDRQYGGLGSDPYHNAVLSGRANYDFTADVQLDVRGYYTNSTVDYDGFPPPDYEFGNQLNYQTTRQYFGYTGLNFNFLNGQWKNRLYVDYTYTDRADYLATDTTPIQNDHYSGTNTRVDYQGNVAIADGYSAVFGLQQEKYLMNSTPYAPSEANTGDNSAYAQVQGELVKGLTVTAGERFDHYDAFGEHFTGQLAAAWVLPSATILRSSWGQGFKAPSLYQLYSPYGNQDLQAERSHDWDAGIEQRFFDNRAMVSATYFDINFVNLIEFADCPGSPLCAEPGHAMGYYVNLGQAKSSGEEFQASLKLTDNLTLLANYTHMKTIDETPGSATYGMPAFNRPGEAGNLTLTYAWPSKLSTSVAVRYSGASFSENFNAFPAAIVTLGGYTLVNIRASYSINDHFDVYGRVDNLTNKVYETVYQYGTWGRTAFLGARIKF